MERLDDGNLHHALVGFVFLMEIDFGWGTYQLCYTRAGVQVLMGETCGTRARFFLVGTLDQSEYIFSLSVDFFIFIQLCSYIIAIKTDQTCRVHLVIRCSLSCSTNSVFTGMVAAVKAGDTYYPLG